MQGLFRPQIDKTDESEPDGSRKESQSSLRNDENLEPEKQKFDLEPGQKFPLDPVFYYYNCIQIRVLDQLTTNAAGTQVGKDGLLGNQSGTQPKRNDPDRLQSNRGRFTGRDLSREISIEKLIKLELNNGPGEFVSGPEPDSLCVCIKR